jgi:hypothetical protein
VNLTAKTTELERVPAYVTKSDTQSVLWFNVLVFCSFVLHAFVAYSQRPFQSTAMFELLLGTINFGAMVMLFYGLSRQYFLKQHAILSLSVVAGVLTCLIFTIKASTLVIISGICAVVLVSIVCGYLSMKQLNNLRIYVFSLMVLLVFASVQLYPLWTNMISGAEDALNLISGEMQQILITSGYSQSAADQLIEQFGVFYLSFVRLVPAMTLMAFVLQFSFGFYLFLRWRNKSGIANSEIAPFIKWKMPFALTPVLLLAVIMRLVGTGVFTLVADNLILILAVYYSVTGISLMEFLMKKIHVSLIGRILIYILLFLSHVIGFALLAVLGFADSFYDWRRKYPLPLDIKTS